MGSHQENWFYNQLTKSSARGATWRIIGNQIIFSSITESYGLSGDNWNVSYYHLRYGTTSEKTILTPIIPPGLHRKPQQNTKAHIRQRH